MSDAISKTAGADVSEGSNEHDVHASSINTVRTLAMDAVERAGCGHPGTPMGLAPLAYALWTRVMSYTSTDPGWPDRRSTPDRLVGLGKSEDEPENVRH